MHQMLMLSLRFVNGQDVGGMQKVVGKWSKIERDINKEPKQANIIKTNYINKKGEKWKK